MLMSSTIVCTFLCQNIVVLICQLLHMLLPLYIYLLLWFRKTCVVIYSVILSFLTYNIFSYLIGKKIRTRKTENTEKKK